MAHRYKVIKGGPYPHFITCSMVRWMPVFVSGPYFRIILDSLEHLRQNRGLLIHAYVIMLTHIHLIVTASADDLSAIIRDFKRFTARAIYEQSERDGNKLLSWVFRDCAEENKRGNIKVWQDESHPEAIYSRPFFEQKADYIHDNPRRRELLKDPLKWYYSSASGYHGGEPGPLEVDWIEW